MEDKTLKNEEISVAYYYSRGYSSFFHLEETRKMHGVKRVVVFFILIVILPATLIIIPLYLRHTVYADVIYKVAESDILEIRDGISSIFCQQHTLRMDSNFNAFQLSSKPEISTNRKHIRLKKSMVLPDDTLEYWGFYLLKGAIVQLKFCSRYEGSRILVVKGERNLQTCGLLEHNKNKFGANFAEGHEKVKVTFEDKEEFNMMSKDNETNLDNKDDILNEPASKIINNNNNLSSDKFILKTIFEPNRQKENLNDDELDNYAGEDLTDDNKLTKLINEENKIIKIELNNTNNDNIEKTEKVVINNLENIKTNLTESIINQTDFNINTDYTQIISTEKPGNIRIRNRHIKKYSGHEGTRSFITNSNHNLNLSTDLPTLQNHTIKQQQQRRHRRHHHTNNMNNQNKNNHNLKYENILNHEHKKQQIINELNQRRRPKRDQIYDRKISHGGNAFNFTEKDESNSISSFENNLLSCYDGKILLAEGFPPSAQCTNVHFLSKNGSHMSSKHEVVEDGYYYYIFYSDNDLVRNDIHAIFDIYKPTFQYSHIARPNNNKQQDDNNNNDFIIESAHPKFCINSTNCTFPLNFYSNEYVIVEVPTRDGIEHDEDDITYLISTCHPRMSVYVIFPISVLVLILGCSFL